MVNLYFQYGDKEISYLKSKDKQLSAAIEQIGHIDRLVMPDCFSAIIYNIIGQQISTSALDTIWNRLLQAITVVKEDTIISLTIEQLQSLGMTFRKAEYIKNFAEKVHTKEIDLEELPHLSDERVVEELSKIRGVGKWTAEMILIFTMQRMDVVSYGDLAILRGMRMLYHHRKLDKQKFDKYVRRYSPYGTVASLYLWAIAGGAIAEVKHFEN